MWKKLNSFLIFLKANSENGTGKDWCGEFYAARFHKRRSDSEGSEPEKRTHTVWDYSHVKLDLPPGLTNRRRIWQILEDMNSKELDVLDEPDFIVLDDHLDRFISRTVKDGVNVEDPDTTCLDWESPSSIDGDVREDWLAPDGCAATGTGDLDLSW